MSKYSKKFVEFTRPEISMKGYWLLYICTQFQAAVLINSRVFLFWRPKMNIVMLSPGILVFSRFFQTLSYLGHLKVFYGHSHVPDEKLTWNRYHGSQNEDFQFSLTKLGWHDLKCDQRNLRVECIGVYCLYVSVPTKTDTTKCRLKSTTPRITHWKPFRRTPKTYCGFLNQGEI